MQVAPRRLESRHTHYMASYRLIIGILQIAIKDKQSTVNKQKQQKEVQVCTGVAHY